MTILGTTEDFKYKDGQQEAAAKLFESISYQAKLSRDNEEAKAALKDASRLELKLFDNRIYQLSIGKIGKKGEEKYFVDIVAPSESSEVQDKVLKDMLTSSVFELPRYEATKFLKTKADFKQ